MSLISYLQGAGSSFATIAAAPVGGDLVAIAASATNQALYAALTGATAKVYPIDAPEATAAPYAVYALLEGRTMAVDGAQVGTVMVYGVMLHAADPDALSALVDLVPGVLTNGMEITDISMDVARTAGVYSAALEVNIFQPAITGSYPMLLVSEIGSNAAGTETDAYINQRTNHNYSISILTSANDMAARRAELRALLIGWQETADHTDMEYREGDFLPVGGGLAGWREVYTNAIYYTAQI